VTHFEVWAPLASRVRVRVRDQQHELTAAGAGWWHADVPAAPGEDYGYLLDDDDEPLPDPRSRWQPEGVHRRSRVYDQDAFRWTDTDWPGRPLPDAIIYELHIGTFTPAGTFDEAIERLDHLQRIGVTHVEPLPVNAVDGVWNWGYDGVDWYAVHEPYGGPDGLKRFVDACHARGMAVVLDVVYNHFGPSGNYLPRFGPYLKPGRNAWGDPINLEEPAVRRFIIENALMWLRDFHVDGLRLDAVHALVDTSTPHLLADLSAEVAALSSRLERPLTLIAESDLNDPIMIISRSEGGYGLDAQWDDDVHHALHALLTGERQGYYGDFGSLAALAKVLTSAFFHDGTYSAFRGRPHGRPVDRAQLPGYRFVVCLQNHDQVGNRAVGDRLPEITSDRLLRVGAVLLLSSPFTPMLWMGEEWAASNRWPFFASHPEPQLAEATGRGRIDEFARHGWDVEQVISPQDPAAYHSAILDWSQPSNGAHAQMMEFYRTMIALRAAEPDLRDPRLDTVRVDFDEAAGWLVVHRGGLRVVVNLATAPQVVPAAVGELLLATEEPRRTGTGLELAPESAVIGRAGGR
jgi:maltooligosyltrehalose trehalohydrolase